MINNIEENYKYIVNTSKFFSINDVFSSILLYQPIVKHEAISVYLTLLSERNFLSNYSVNVKHERLLSIMGISKIDFYNSICELERVGLLRTYFKKQLVNSTVVYEIFSPKEPKDFFETTYLYNAFEICLGSSNSNVSKEYFKIQNTNVSGYEDVTEIQNLDYSDSHNFNTAVFDYEQVQAIQNVNKNKLSHSDNYISKNDKTVDYSNNNAMQNSSDDKESTIDFIFNKDSEKKKNFATSEYSKVKRNPIIGTLSDDLRRIGVDPSIINSNGITIQKIEELYELFKPEIPYLSRKIKTLMQVEKVNHPELLIKRLENILKIELNPYISNSTQANTKQVINNNENTNNSLASKEFDITRDLNIRPHIDASQSLQKYNLNEERTSEEKMGNKISFIKNLTPEDYLKKRGNSLSEKDVQTIDNLLEIKKLNSQVVNVIIDHNFNKNSYFNSNYSIKIGETMKKRNITTAEEAINFLKKSYDNSSKTQNQKTIFNSDNSSIADFGDIF